MSPVLIVARNELRHLVRSRIALTGLALTALLTLAAALTSSAYQADQAGLRARLQAAADAEFESQPDRHPHRVVHYGHFAVRPASGLAALDPGVEAFTGNLIFLEGHRQNSANFGDARQSSLLVRFGQLSPALVLQVVVPLLLVFIGAAAIAGERERGTLRQALLAGTPGRSILGGKALALGAATAAIAAPALVLLVWLAAAGPARPSAVLLAAVGYSAYLAFWIVLIVAVSALAGRSRTALMALVGAWAFSVILVPRVSPEIAAAARPLPTRIETDIAIARDLRAMGDSHNPDDPYFAAFKQRTLQQYGVTRVEDLPVNYRGLLAVEGEKLTSTLFNRYADQAFAAMAGQSRIMDALAILSPTIAIRRLSMTAAETDLAGYRRFLQQAEAYRYDLVQRLNWLQARAVDAEDDAAKSRDAAAEARSRISAEYWRDMPQFQPGRPAAGEVIQAALPALAVLVLWLAAAGLLAARAAQRLSRSAR
jgi:ABC-2 type transport system permease protein